MGLDGHPGRDTKAGGPTWRAMLRISLPASGSEGMVGADRGAAQQLRVHQEGQVRRRAWIWVHHSTWTPMANPKLRLARGVISFLNSNDGLRDWPQM